MQLSWKRFCLKRISKVKPRISIYKFFVLDFKVVISLQVRQKVTQNYLFLRYNKLEFFYSKLVA